VQSPKPRFIRCNLESVVAFIVFNHFLGGVNLDLQLGRVSCSSRFRMGCCFILGKSKRDLSFAGVWMWARFIVVSSLDRIVFAPLNHHRVSLGARPFLVSGAFWILDTYAGRVFSIASSHRSDRCNHFSST